MRAFDRFPDRSWIGYVHLQRDRGAVREQHPRELPARPLRGAGDKNDFFTDVE
jgi:hypothetical protein